MRIYLYTLKHDGGFAPNPFYGYCTLACCKPKIRRRAEVGDWVVGITPRALGNRLAYAMRVSEVLTFGEFWSDRRFRKKRPKWTSRRRIERFGDNCYQPLPNGRYRQLPSAHWDSENKRENRHAKATDLGGEKVLVARHFSYFGAEALELPDSFSSLMPARYSRVNFTAVEQEDLQNFVQDLPTGIHGRPRGWASDDRQCPHERCKGC